MKKKNLEYSDRFFVILPTAEPNVAEARDGSGDLYSTQPEQYDRTQDRYVKKEELWGQRKEIMVKSRLSLGPKRGGTSNIESKEFWLLSPSLDFSSVAQEQSFFFLPFAAA